MYFLKTGSPEHTKVETMIFEPLMVITGIVQPLATIPSISKLYFTHSHPCFRSIIRDLVHLCLSPVYCGSRTDCSIGKPAIYAGNIIGLVMNLLTANGILMNAGWTY